MLTRHLVTAAALAVAAPTAVPNPLALATPTDAPTTSSAPQVTAPKVRGWSFELTRRAATSDGQKVTGKRSFETVGVTWRRGSDPGIEVRTRAQGVWSPWQAADRISVADETATEPIWVDTAQAVEVRVARWRPGLAVVMVDPGEDSALATGLTDEGVRSRPAPLRSAAVAVAGGSGYAPQPHLFRRSEWGADERLREGRPYYLKGIKQAHVHHTASTSDYSRADVPGIIRGMYWYHTQRLGWSDIGYNFLVDRFGRIWVGRAGGTHKAVRGAHTLGFNHASFGVASIGNHEEYGASSRMLGGLVRLIAWKLDRQGHAPASRVRILSHGSDRYPAGTRVRLPRIDGHRDTNYTACPGRRLYKWLPEVRRRAQARAERWN